MKSQTNIWEAPQVTFCANSDCHYIIEEKNKYCLPLYLAIQLNVHLRSFRNSSVQNPVSTWIGQLPAEERQLINITPV